VWDFRFYEASAQILPVLYLAVLVEYRLLHQRWQELRPWPRALFATATFYVGVTFALGEFQALDVVSRGPDETPTGEPIGILAAYLLAFGMLVWPLVERARDAEQELGRLRGWLVLLGGVAAFVLFLWFVALIVPSP
jgi:hypothetical protein